MEEVWKDAAKNPATQQSHPVKTPSMPLHVNHNRQADDIPGRGRRTAEPPELEAPKNGGGSLDKETPHNGRKAPHNLSETPHNLSETPHKGRGRIHGPRGRTAMRGNGRDGGITFPPT